MSQGAILCGFCLEAMKAGDQLGQVEPILEGDKCHHRFHYICMIKALCDGPKVGESHCRFCGQVYFRVLPVRSTENPIFVVINNSAPVGNLSPDCASTSAISTPSSVVLNSVQLVPASPSCSISSADSPQQPKKPTKARAPKIQQVIYRGQAQKKILKKPKVELFGKPFALTCQECMKVHPNRTEKKRCMERHMGPYSCPLCGHEPFPLHSSMRTHHLTSHGVKWMPEEEGM